MELRDYIAIRRAYNLVRQTYPRRSRMTFAEFAILCHMYLFDGSLNTTEIAKYQNVLRPTMTHRTKHLSGLGLIERTRGDNDHRHILCSVTDEGRAFVQDICEQVCAIRRQGDALRRIEWERACRYIEAMGSLDLKASDLVLLGIMGSEEGTTVSSLVDALGLLQPTVSMSVSALMNAGMIDRGRDGARRLATVSLTQKGRSTGEELCQGIDELLVRRK